MTPAWRVYLFSSHPPQVHGRDVFCFKRRRKHTKGLERTYSGETAAGKATGRQRVSPVSAIYWQIQDTHLLNGFLHSCFIILSHCCCFRHTMTNVSPSRHQRKIVLYTLACDNVYQEMLKVIIISVSHGAGDTALSGSWCRGILCVYCIIVWACWVFLVCTW